MEPQFLLGIVAGLILGAAGAVVVMIIVHGLFAGKEESREIKQQGHRPGP